MKGIIKKWWFWVITLCIAAIISITLIIIVAMVKVTSGIDGLAIDIQNIHKDATVYISAGENTVVIELRNWDTDDIEKFSEIINEIKKEASNGILKNYSNFITITYLKNNNNEDSLVIKHEYSLPDFIEKSKEEYIVFDEYTELFNKYDNTMKSYTNLFDSIY